jgi:hypothetical protein
LSPDAAKTRASDVTPGRRQSTLVLLGRLERPESQARSRDFFVNRSTHKEFNAMAFRLGPSEIVKCEKCGGEFELLYDERDVVVAKTDCLCQKKISHKRKKSLDLAIEKVKKEFPNVFRKS